MDTIIWDPDTTIQCGRIADKLLESPHAQDVHLVQMLAGDGSTVYHLLVVVDAARAEDFLARCLSPLTVHETDSAENVLGDTIATWPTERPEGIQEAALNILGFGDEELFLMELGYEHDARQLLHEGDIVVAVVMPDWPDQINRFAGIYPKPHTQEDAVRSLAEWGQARDNRLVYNPNVGFARPA
jgi:hypothetical protein